MDEEEFTKEASADDRYFRRNPRPYGVGAITPDPQRVYESLSPRYPEMKVPYSRPFTSDPKGPNLWTFCSLPSRSTPGAEVFSLKYLLRAKDTYELRMGLNTVFAVGGLVFCSETPVERIKVWVETFRDLTPGLSVKKGEGFSFGEQRFRWITPSEYQREFRNPWTIAQSECGDIAAVRLLAKDLNIAQRSFEGAGFATGESQGEPGFLVAPDANSGYAFLVESGDPDRFLTALNALSAR